MPLTATALRLGGISFLCLILLFPVLSLGHVLVILLQRHVYVLYRGAETAISKHLSLVSKTSYGPFSLYVLCSSFKFLALFKPAMLPNHGIVFL